MFHMHHGGHLLVVHCPLPIWVVTYWALPHFLAFSRYRTLLFLVGYSQLSYLLIIYTLSMRWAHLLLGDTDIIVACFAKSSQWNLWRDLIRCPPIFCSLSVFFFSLQKLLSCCHEPPITISLKTLFLSLCNKINGCEAERIDHICQMWLLFLLLVGLSQGWGLSCCLQKRRTTTTAISTERRH